MSHIFGLQPLDKKRNGFGAVPQTNQITEMRVISTW
jgi:hypothetical protein